jgi:hypothetical protein
MKSRLPFLSLAAAFLSVPVIGQVVYNDVDDVYYQNFDNEAGWPTSTTALPWTDGSTFNGWYAAVYGGNDTPTYTAPATIKPAQSAYTSATYLYLFRRTDNPTNGALGSYSLGAAPGSGVYYGVYIQNNTGADITSFSFGYTGIQTYSYANVGVQTLDVSYSLDATALSDGVWSAVPSMTFNTPQAPYSTTGSFSLNTENPGNRVQLGTTISGISIANGEGVWIRWFDVSDSGNDNGMAIDDFYFTVAGAAVPEPSAWGAIVGGLALSVATLRRRRR